MICNAVHLFKVNKIPLVEKTLRLECSNEAKNSNLSSGSGQVNLAKFYGNANKLTKFQKKM